MKNLRNLNLFDQVIRLLIAAVCLYFGFVDTSFVQENILALGIGIFGVLNVIAGLVGFCPVYKLAGINTYRPEGKAAR